MMQSKNEFVYHCIRYGSVTKSVWTDESLILFGLILYVPINNFSVMLGQVFLGGISTKQWIKCLAQGHNTVTPQAVRLELTTIQSPVELSTTANQILRTKNCEYLIIHQFKHVLWIFNDTVLFSTQNIC